MANLTNTITRHKYERDFTIIANECLRDNRLSWKAKGIIAYVSTLPDTWVLNLRELQTHATDGRDSIYSGIRELEEYGYCRKSQRKKEDGRFAGYEYEICDKCVFQSNDTENTPHTEKPHTEKPHTENPTLLNTNNKEEINITNNSAATKVASQTLPGFEDKSKKRLFRNSNVYALVKINEKGERDYTSLLEQFSSREYDGIDIVYYFHAVEDWSEQRDMKRTDRGWIATIRNFIRSDIERNKLHKTNHSQGGMNVADAMDFLNSSY